MVVRTANWINLPPEPEGKILPSAQELAAQFRKDAEDRYAIMKADNDEHQRRLEQSLKDRPHGKQKATCAWVGKQERRRRKRLGLPPPTPAELLALKKQIPIYGQKLHK